MIGYKETIGNYEKTAKQYAQAIEALAPVEAIRIFSSILPVKGRILDAGCAAGRDSALFAKKGLIVHGMDLSDGLIKIAKEKHPSLCFQLGDFRNMPYPASFFDGIWSHASLVHFDSIKEVRKALGEFFRVLKKGGFLFVRVKKQHSSKKTDSIKDKLSRKRRFFRYFTQEEISGLVLDAGFSLVSLSTEMDSANRSDVKWIELIARKK